MHPNHGLINRTRSSLELSQKLESDEDLKPKNEKDRSRNNLKVADSFKNGHFRLKSFAFSHKKAHRRVRAENRPHSSQLLKQRTLLQDPPEPEDPAVVVRTCKPAHLSTSYGIHHLYPLSRLHNLVLQVVAGEIAKEAQPLRFRRRSCESDRYSGGPIRKFNKLNYLSNYQDDVARFFRDTVPRKMNSQPGVSFHPSYDFRNKIPWFLHRRSQVLDHNLAELLHSLIQHTSTHKDPVQAIDARIASPVESQKVEAICRGPSEWSPGPPKPNARLLRSHTLVLQSTSGSVRPFVDESGRPLSQKQLGLEGSTSAEPYSVWDLPHGSERSALVYSPARLEQIPPTLNHLQNSKIVQMHLDSCFDVDLVAQIIKLSCYYCQSGRTQEQVSTLNLNSIKNSPVLFQLFRDSTVPVIESVKRKSAIRESYKSRSFKDNHEAMTDDGECISQMSLWISQKLKLEKESLRRSRKKSITVQSSQSRLPIQNRVFLASPLQKNESSLTTSEEQTPHLVNSSKPLKKCLSELQMMMKKTKRLKLQDLELYRLRRSQYMQRVLTDAALTSQFFIKDAFKSLSGVGSGIGLQQVPAARVKSEDSLWILTRSPKPNCSGPFSAASKVHSSATTRPPDQSAWSGRHEGRMQSQANPLSCRVFFSPRPSQHCLTEHLRDFNSRRMSSARTDIRISTSKPASAYKTSAVQSTLPFFISKLNC